jgi:hypothetical protein
MITFMLGNLTLEAHFSHLLEGDWNINPDDNFMSVYMRSGWVDMRNISYGGCGKQQTEFPEIPTSHCFCA